MKNWWLELYTIPNLKAFSKAFVISLIFVVVVGLFVPDFLFLTVFGACIYMGLTLFKSSNVSLAANMEFHKLHVPYRELRSALVKNCLIQFSVVSFACMILFLVSIYFSKSALDDLGFYIVGLGVIAGLSQYFKIMVFKPVIGAQYQMIDGKKYPIKSFLSMMVFGCFLIFAMFILGLLDFSPMGAMNFAFLTIAFGFIWFLYRAPFHLEMQKGTSKTYFKYMLKSTFPALVVNLVLMVIASPLSKLPGLDKELKHVAFEFAGPFAPELDPMEAAELLSVLQPQISLILRKTPGIENFPISQLMPKGHSSDYIYYLKHVQKPGVSNLVHILNRVSLKEKQDLYDRGVIQMALMRWPKDKKFPEYLMVKKNKEEKRPKEERLPASNEPTE